MTDLTPRPPLRNTERGWREPGVRSVSLGVLLCLFAALSFCRKSSSNPFAGAPKLDVILVTIDTLRADAPGFSGKSRAGTPNLDRMAREGIVFMDAHAHNVITLPSHVNIFTGLYPYQHGVRDNDGFRLDEKFPTLATVL